MNSPTSHPMTPGKMRANGVRTLVLWCSLPSLALLATLAPARANEKPYDPYKWCAVGSDGGGLIVLPTAINKIYRNRIISLAARYRLPAIYPFSVYVTSGGLFSYGIETNDLLRRSASYVDRILKGEKPADLPVQAPIKYELVINLKTAKKLGLTVPPSLLAHADEVIE